MDKGEVLLDVTVYDGKYRIVQWRNVGTRAFRYMADVSVDDLDPDNPWLDCTNTPGSNMILALAYEVSELRERTTL